MSPTSKLDFWQLRFWHGGRVTKSFTVNFLFMIEKIPCRYILIKCCVLTHKKRFCDKANINYEKMSPTSKLDFWQLRFWHGGRVAKSFTVNFLFMIETIPCRYILIKYCIVTHKNRFCDKAIVSYEKMSPTSKLDFWQLRFWHGGRVTKSFTVNFLFMIETIPWRYILIKCCMLTHKKCFWDIGSILCKNKNLTWQPCCQVRQRGLIPHEQMCFWLKNGMCYYKFEMIYKIYNNYSLLKHILNLNHTYLSWCI